MTINWTAELSVGDPEIDHDHKELFDLINELETANMNHDYINTILDRLKRYTQEHFDHEVVYMSQNNYPELNTHVKEHNDFIEWLVTIKAMYIRCPESPFIVGDSVNSYLNRWWTEHILKQDMAYKDYILSLKNN
jgi:hemerythrin